MSRRKLLLVEQDATTATLIEKMVAADAHDQFEVTHVVDLAEGTATYEAGEFDVVLLDTHLPDASSDLDALRRAMTWRPEPCVVVLTANASTDVGLQSLQSGAHDYLLKSTLTAPILGRVVNYAFERHQRRERRRVEFSDLRDRVEDLEAYVSAVSHDLRGPLATAMSMLALVRDRHGELSGTQLEVLLSRIHAGLARGLQFADDLLEDARQGDEGRGELDLSAIASEALALATIPDTVTVIIEDFPVGVWGRSAGLVQILTNLISNAERHVPVPGRILVRGEDHDATVHIIVEDNGTGVPPERRAEIFDFGRTGDEGHTGIGLATVERQASVHGGKVWVDESERLGGARFVVELPRRLRKRVAGDELMISLDERP